MMKGEYSQYLMSPKWQDLKMRILDRDHRICQGCLERTASEVHHTSYSHLGDELCFELVSLCRECHARIHDKDGD